MKETVTMLNQQYVVPEGLQPYQGVTANSPWLASETEKRRRKICDSLEEAIRRSGLKNGMTISFHHAFRGGDKVVNMVMAKLAEMGFRDLTLASSSLIDAHWPLIEHIKKWRGAADLHLRAARQVRGRDLRWPDGKPGTDPLSRRPRKADSER